MAVPNHAWATLVTRSSYLAGVIILAYTLRKHHSSYPLVVLYTDALPRSSIEVLEKEAKNLNIIPRRTDALLPKENVHVQLIAERFADTWTKLRVFELLEYDKVCYLDADMIICRDMDPIFEKELPGKDWLAANHACVCNLDKDPWAPEDWIKENCAYTPLEHPTALSRPTEVKPHSRPTYHLLNSGTFMFYPSQSLWDEMMEFFTTTPKLSEFKFPDQDFLAEFFRNRWMSIGWQYNALKTMRYWHPNIWRDEEVVCLHYIVDKPWAKRIGPDGIAGYLSRDGVTHAWWWEVFQEWEISKEGDENHDVLEAVRSHAARPLDDKEHAENEELRAIGSQVQAFANKKSDKCVDE